MKVLIFLITFFSVSTAFGETVQKIATKAKSPLGIKLETARYDYGHGRAAVGDLYSFDRILVIKNSFGYTYNLGNAWSAHVETNITNLSSELKFQGRIIENETEGMGDSFAGVSKIKVLKDKSVLIGKFGFSLPTGAVDVKNPRNPSLNQAYFQQLGSGTIDPQLTALYLKPLSKVTWGNLLFADMKVGRNKLGYRRGRTYLVSSWAEYNFKSYLKPSLRAQYKYVGKIDGMDPTLGRNAFTEYYHDIQQAWEVDLALSGQTKVAFLGNGKLSYTIGIPVLQEMKNNQNLLVNGLYYAKLGIEI